MHLIQELNEGTRRAFRPVYAYAKRHEDPWEIAMAILAVAFVLTGFAGEFLPAYAVQFDALDLVLTAVFVLEFALRFLGSPSRLRYFKEHLLDVIALIPLARGVRLFRLLRLLRLVRAVKGFHHAFVNAERLSNHYEFGTLVIAWFGILVICASAFFLAEGDVNPALNEPGDAVWWGIATLTGGNADVLAMTDEGRFITAVLRVFGVALLTAITAVLVSFLVRQPTSAPAADAGVAAAAAADPLPTAPAADRLREIASLRDSGLIDAEEYDSARAGILESLER